MSTSRVEQLNNLLGRPVLSVVSANKLGQVDDLVVDPLRGELAGLSVQTLEASHLLVNRREIHSIGPDAVMVNSDQSLGSAHDSPIIQTFPLAKNNLIGVKVISEGGQLLGEITNVYIILNETYFLIYEVRSSILDKLLGNAFYFPASFACAFSEDATRLVVSSNIEEVDRTLDAIVTRLLKPTDSETPEIIVRTKLDT